MAKQSKKRNSSQSLSDKTAKTPPREQSAIHWPPAGWVHQYYGPDKYRPKPDQFIPPPGGFSLKEAREWTDALILRFREAELKENLPHDLIDGGVKNAFLLVEDVQRRGDRPLPPLRRVLVEYGLSPIVYALDDLERIRDWFDRAIFRAEKRSTNAARARAAKRRADEKAATDRLAAEKTAADPYARFAFNIKSKEVIFDKKSYVMEDELHVAFLKQLIEAHGRAIPGPELIKDPCLKNVGRFDTLRKSLREPFKSFVEAESGKGYWIPLNALNKYLISARGPV